LLVELRRKGEAQVFARRPGGKRVQRVFLTEQGQAIEQTTAVFEEEVNAHALAGFSADERAFFLRLLTRALQNSEGK